MKTFFNNRVVGGDLTLVEVTSAEYAALSQQEKEDPSILYRITDQDVSDEEILLGQIMAAIGDNTVLAEYGDGTLVGALVTLHQRLGGLSFGTNANNELVATVNPAPTPATPVTIDNNMTDKQKLQAINTALGSTTTLATETGYSTISEAILALFDKLNGLSFSYDSTNQEVSVTYGEDDTPSGE